MKKIFLLLAVAPLALLSCNKSEVQEPSDTLSVTAQDDLSVAKQRAVMLVAHPWMYQGFYFHYVNKHDKGDPEYIRGAINNDIDLDATRITFRSNGTFLELDGGYRYPGTWEFTDNTATVMIMHYSWGDDACTFTNLNGNHLNFTQPMGYDALSLTELIPAE